MSTSSSGRKKLERLEVPFNKPFMTGKELSYLREAHARGHLSGNGEFTKKCQAWLEQRVGCKKALLTHSCTGALEMAAILAGIGSGDEVIMPSYTFVSTANAFVLRGATPVFVDIRPDTLNIDEEQIEAAITPHTKAIAPVHYAGVACEMDEIMAIAKRHQLIVIEDAAHAVMSSYKGRPLGSIGHLAAFSFHETKNLISGEGGALLINDEQFSGRAEMIWEKGTNRSLFFQGKIDKYTWTDIGSSYLPSELIAAFLWAQMEEADAITGRRLRIWDAYHEAFTSIEASGHIRRPVVPAECRHNAHMYFLLLPNLQKRSAFIRHLQQRGVDSAFHYVPLHDSPMGKKLCRAPSELVETNAASQRVVRLPLWLGMEDALGSVADIAISAVTAG